MKNPYVKRFFNYLPTILVSGIILYLSLIREPNFSLPPVAHMDKIAHFVMYCALALCFMWNLTIDKQLAVIFHCLAIALPSIYGGIIEILQEQFFYPRSGEWSDWIADILGAIIGYSIFIIVCKLIHK